MFKKKNSKEKNVRNKQGASLVTVTKPNDVITENFRSIRTNIQYSMIDKQFKTMMITSSAESEGKSTICVNLASVMADNNKKILVIDADMRRPTLKKTFNLNSSIGLTSILTNEELDVLDSIQYSKESNLYLLSSGPIPPNPSELLASNKMRDLVEKLKDIFDYIIVDTPPVLAVTDAQIVADLVDGAIFVIREGVAEKQAVKKSIELLEITGVNIIGTIFNGADISKNKTYTDYVYSDQEDD